jgi:tetraacyldisaccharide 4'-kinase
VDCREVRLSSLADEVGDEALLIHHHCQVPVVVAARRIQAARALLAQHPQTDVLVCDDGLQHLALHRDIEICVFDERGLGNGWLLPAGPLREPWPRGVDLVLHTGATAAFAGFRARRELDTVALRSDGSRLALSTLRGQTLVAVAGIAHPENFFQMLRAAGLSLSQTVALPDHYSFADWHYPMRRGDLLLCTQKDAVKLWRTHPEALAIPLSLTLEPAFIQALVALLPKSLGAKLSSTQHTPEK